MDGKSCPDGEACLCCVGHGDILVMDGQCQDECLHCTDPGLEQERINVTFRWILSGVVDSDIHLFVADVIKSCDTVARAILDRVLSSLGLPAFFRRASFEYHSLLGYGLNLLLVWVSLGLGMVVSLRGAR